MNYARGKRRGMKEKKNGNARNKGTKKTKKTYFCNFPALEVMHVFPHLLGLEQLPLASQPLVSSLTLPMPIAYVYCLFCVIKFLVSGYMNRFILPRGMLYEHKNTQIRSLDMAVWHDPKHMNYAIMHI